MFAYVGLTVPVIAVGFLAQAFGDFRATLACAIALAVIAVASIAVIRRRRHEPAGALTPGRTRQRS